VSKLPSEISGLPIRRRFSLLGRCLSALLLITVFAYTVYRAVHQSITHDEALTYLWFVADGADLFRYWTGNHVLYSYLAKATTSVLGTTELTLRLPALLGAGLFLVACNRLVGLLAASAATRLALLSLIVLNPLVLDYLAAARGYGLALAFLMWAFVFIARVLLSPMARRGRFARWLLASSLSLGLSVAANLAFLWVCLSTALLTVLLLAFPSPAPSVSKKWRKLGLYFCLPGPLLMGALLFPYWTQIIHSRDQFGFGFPSLAGTIQDLLNASFFHAETSAIVGPPSWTILEIVPTSLACTVASLFMVLLALALVFDAQRAFQNGIWKLPEEVRLRLFFCGTPCLALVFYIGAHLLLGMPYPIDRLSIYGIPMTVLAGYSLFQPYLPHRLTVGMAVIIAALIIARYGMELDPRYFKTWRYDAGSGPIYKRIERLSAGFGKRPVRVGGPWFFEPSLNFYRLTCGGDRWMRAYQRVSLPQAEDYDFYLFYPSLYRVSRAQFRVVYQDPVSGVAVAARNALLLSR
jgi:hypothetical protein